MLQQQQQQQQIAPPSTIAQYVGLETSTQHIRPEAKDFHPGAGVHGV
jgi:hypothetical protein